MSVLVETEDIRVLLDAGAALGARHGLMPHPKEYLALKDARKRIAEAANRAEVVTISHYHFDHYTTPWKNLEAKWTWSSYEESRRIYGGKTVYAKDYREAVNPSQRRRGYLFSRIASDFSGKIIYSDAKRVSLGDTILKFSKPLPHGEEESGLGYVVGITITHSDSKLMFCPDVQGPLVQSTLRLILRSSPDTLIVGGPPEYLSQYRVPETSIQQGFDNLKKVVGKVPLTIVEHHLLRSEKGLDLLQPLRQLAAKNGNRICTAAEFLGLSNSLLEANRRFLYQNFPLDREFQKWLKMSRLRQMTEPPPV